MKILILAILLAPLSSLAIAESTSYATGYSCGEFVAKVAEKPTHQLAFLVAGYVSGANSVRQRLIRGKPDDLNLWIMEYCKKYPFDNLADALNQLDKVLGEGDRKIPNK